jgi:hypothetical protein
LSNSDDEEEDVMEIKGTSDEVGESLKSSDNFEISDDNELGKAVYKQNLNVLSKSEMPEV